jgi:NADH:ubiquinone oxidoreductase subunit H
MVNFLMNIDLSFLYSILNVLFLIVPILLAVAWITVFERKLLAILQRRTGPNVVGSRTKLNKKLGLRFFHKSSIVKNDPVKIFYGNRIIPVKPFDSQIISTCENIIYLKTKNNFF